MPEAFIDSKLWCDTCMSAIMDCVCPWKAEDDSHDDELGYSPPVCPTCDHSYNTFCLECGEDSLGCTCAQSIDWYCGSCGGDWQFDPYTTYEGELLEEIGEELGAVGKVGCTCTPPMDFYCDKCGVVRSTTKEEWRLIPDTKQGKKTAVTKSNTKYGSGYDWNDWDTSWGSSKTTNYYGKDRHYNGAGLRMPTSGMWMYASSHDDKRKPEAFVPDWGLYLDWCWKPDWRHEHIHWPDFSTPTNDVAAMEAIIEAYEKSLNGLTVEVGCIGGHGRTGTVLGCYLTIEGVLPDKAIDMVRQDYCHHAIESAEQEWWIHWFSHELFGTPLPKKPESKGKTTYSTGGKVCQAARDHYVLWKQGLVCKEGTNGQPCGFWAKDKATFNSPTSTMKDAWDAFLLKQQKEGGTSNITTQKPKPRTQIIDGYKVPKPKKGDKHHNPKGARGCFCDLCRYRSKGFGALLESVTPKPSEGETIKVAQPNGTILEIVVADSFEPMPPKPAVGNKPLPSGTTEIVAPGTVRGEYVYVKGEGWVWEGIAQVPKKNLGVKKKGKKKSKKGKK